MAYAGGKEIENSFSLELRNLDASFSHEVDLFRLGADTSNTIPSPINFTTQGLDSFRAFFLFVPNPPQTLEEIKCLGNLVITFTNTDGDTISTASIASASSLNTINAALEGALSATGAWYSGIQVRIVFDFNQPSPFVIFSAEAYVMYNENFDIKTLANKGVISLTMTSSVIGTNTIPISLSLKPAYKTNIATAKSSGVLITARNGVSYGEILESQNGQVLDIKTINFTISTNSSSVDKTQKEQVFNCFTFEKTDMNGNKIEYRKCPVVDVYSNPDLNSIDGIKLERKADVYTLDGTTNVNYSLRGGIVVQISSEFTRLTNLLQESKQGQEQIEVQKRNIKNNRLYTEYALSKEAITTEQKKEEKGFNFNGDVKKKNISTSLHNSILMFGGVGLLLLMFNKKYK
tara:strand:+ start:1004 stop:2215 length:1212 start_codon:yes stop_codon:yes gene_type:complete